MQYFLEIFDVHYDCAACMCEVISINNNLRTNLLSLLSSNSILRNISFFRQKFVTESEVYTTTSLMRRAADSVCVDPDDMVQYSLVMCMQVKVKLNPFVEFLDKSLKLTSYVVPNS